MRGFVIKRQQYLIDPIHSASAQANTVLITGVPRKYLDEKEIARLFSHVPGGVKKVWLNRDLKDLPDLYERRLNASDKLEDAEIALLKMALKLKKTNGGKLPETNDLPNVEGGRCAADAFVPPNERPTHRLPVLGFLPFGKKVDTIEWATQEILDTTKELEKERDILASEVGAQDHTRVKYPALNSVFVLFNQQIGTHIAAQILTHHGPYRMAQKYTEVAPADIIFDNLGKS
jgi:calcium permeable stress-gated cation channel